MIVKSYEEIVAEAVSARAEVERIKTLVEAAHAAWLTEFRATAPDDAEPADPEVEWDDPGSEKEAVENLRVAFLGGELTRAREALSQARRSAREITRASMRRAAVEGRRAWEARNIKWEARNIKPT